MDRPNSNHRNNPPHGGQHHNSDPKPPQMHREPPRHDSHGHGRPHPEPPRRHEPPRPHEPAPRPQPPHMPRPVRRHGRKGSIIPVLVIIIVALILVAVMSNKRKNNEPDDKVASASTVANVQTSGDIVIDTTKLDSTVAFIDYVALNMPMAVMAVKDSEGNVRIAFNTSEHCQGSPYAFYKQSGKYLICQNCRKRIPIDEIGETADGCYPALIEYEVDGDNIIISEATLNSMTQLFLFWKRGL